jgi:transcriptional regulator with XRE-family HTH domain
VFWDDLGHDLEDPVYFRAFVLEQNRINTVDRVMNQLIEGLETSKLSRADVARVLDAKSATVRRWFNKEATKSTQTNPTLRTLSDLAAVLGYRIDLVPLKGEERKQVTGALTAEVTSTAKTQVGSEAKVASQKVA